MKTRLLMIIGIIGFTGLFVSDASGFDMSPLQSADEHLEFIDFQSTYQAGIPIQFILEKTRNSNCNSYNAKITDEDGNFIWGGGADISCDAINNTSSEISQTKIGYNENHSIIINESGTYYLEVEFSDAFTKREFKVRQNTAGGTIDRTAYPVSNPDPLDLWNSADVIIDGTIIDIEYTNSDNDNNIPNYHIKVNKYFKGVHEIRLVFAQNDLHVSEFNVNDTGLFYLKAGDTTGYSIQSHSVKTFGDCTARDLIEISPVLPNEGFPRSAPTRSESYFDPCMANYFTYDPDFFAGILNGISPLKQTKHGIPNDLIRCYDDLVKITKHDDSPACVTTQTKSKLVERGWVAFSDALSSFEIITRESDLAMFYAQPQITTVILKQDTTIRDHLFSYLKKPDGWDHVFNRAFEEVPRNFKIGLIENTPNNIKEFVQLGKQNLPSGITSEILQEGGYFVVYLTSDNQLELGEYDLSIISVSKTNAVIQMPLHVVAVDANTIPPQDNIVKINSYKQSWGISLEKISEQEYWIREDRRNPWPPSPILNITDENIHPHVKELIDVMWSQNTRYIPSEYDSEILIAEHEIELDVEPKKIKDWLKTTHDKQFKQNLDDSFSSYIRYDDKIYSFGFIIAD